MELVFSDVRMQKLINKVTFKYFTSYSENLPSVSLENKIIKFDKPIYIGFVVLDISKSLMYDYHYNVMKRHYSNSITLMYTDTGILFYIIIYIYIFIYLIFSGSQVYYICANNFYKNIQENSNLLDPMDTSNLSQNHPCYINESKKIPGLFSDETDGRTIYEFIALRAKSYAYNIENKEKIKAKGIRGLVKNHMTFNDHKRCLFGDVDLDCYTKNISIRSYKHQISTIKTNKLTYNSHDDKRYIPKDQIHTLAHGQYKIE